MGNGMVMMPDRVLAPAGLLRSRTETNKSRSNAMVVK